MRNGRFKVVALLVFGVFGLAACSSGGGEEGGEALPTCEGSAVSNTGLPDDFPVPADVTFTETTTAGPSTVVDGFATDDVEHLYEEWKEILEQVDYTILFDESEAPDDAEISYKSADESSTGQIALRNECGGGEKIAVHVTDRPA